MGDTLSIDTDYVQDVLLRLLQTYSPTGYTDPIVRLVSKELDRFGIDYELTRRGAIRANLPGRQAAPARAIVSHLDTLGAMVRELKPNGRLALAPVGTWSSRFAEGARVSIFTDRDVCRGTILPLLASGHRYDSQIDAQPINWDQVEVRVDAHAATRQDLADLGFHVGDFVGIDADPEISPNGFINSRHLDDKGGVAAVLGTIKAITESRLELPTNCHALFTISEETGSGASAILHGDVAEMVTVDNGTCGADQKDCESAVTIAMADSSGPFDYHLSHHLIQLCQHFELPHHRDIFRHYRSDSASAVEAGNDIRTALVAFGVDASHGYERTHKRSLEAVAQLLTLYVQTQPLFRREAESLSNLQGFPSTKKVMLSVTHPSDGEDGKTIMVQEEPEG